MLVSASARHCHLTEEHIEILFGKPLTVFKPLYQPGFFAANEILTIVGNSPTKLITNLRVLGPSRRYTQVELSETDARFLKVDAPIRLSGEILNTPGCTLIGPEGAVKLKKGVIKAARHLHLSYEQASSMRIYLGDRLKLLVESPRCDTILEDIIARPSPHGKFEVHIDTDEANACNLKEATRFELLDYPRLSSTEQLELITI